MTGRVLDQIQPMKFLRQNAILKIMCVKMEVNVSISDKDKLKYGVCQGLLYTRGFSAH